MPADPVTTEPTARPKLPIREDLAYILPMAAFMLFVFLGAKGPELTVHQAYAGHYWYPWTYLARVIVVGAMLVWFWPAFTRIRWNGWWLGVIVGLLGTAQWIGMQLLLQQHFDFFKPSDKVFNPELFFADPAVRWAFILLRMTGAVIVVPVMEELFWRDYVWRTIIAPNDFKLAQVGEWDWKAFLIVPLVFSLVHGNWWATAIVWALMIGGLLAWTRSLGACIIAHATTNLLLALWVLYTKQWFFW